MTNIEKSIVKTIAYYEALGQYPLTAVEIFQYLQKEDGVPVRPSLWHLVSFLKKSPNLAKYLQSKNGFFFLKNGSRFYEQRIARQKIAIAKWRKVRRIAVYLALTPFLRGLFVSGSLAFFNTKPASDLDFLVITKINRIWTGRTFLSFLLQLIGQRRHDQVIANKICLNHYLAQDGLTVSLQNLSNAHLYSHLVPLTNYSDYQLFQTQNHWLANFLFCYPQSKQHHQYHLNQNAWLFRAGRASAGLVEWVLGGALGNWLEKRLDVWQTRRIRQKTSFRQLDEQELVLSDKALLFHYPICKNREVMDEYTKKVQTIFST